VDQRLRRAIAEKPAHCPVVSFGGSSADTQRFQTG
jgi:hypothetical protein